MGIMRFYKRIFMLSMFQIAFDMSQAQSTAAVENLEPDCDEVVSNSGNTKAKTSRVKTEPANGYLQFVQARKKAELALDHNFKLNMRNVQNEWKELSEVGQAVYKEMAQMEKIELGNNFRKKQKSQDQGNCQE